MSDDLVLGLLVAVAGLMGLILISGLVLVVRDTVRGKGRWGINLQPVECPTCGEPAPPIRAPATFRQALWGGHTCLVCGTEFDKWGRAVSKAQEQD